MGIPKKFIILQYCSFLLLAFMTDFKLLIGYTRTPGYILELTLVTAVGYILLNMLYLSIASTSKFFVWLAQGEAPSVFMFYPIIIQRYPKFKIFLSFNPFNYLEDFYPSSWMNNVDSTAAIKQLEEKYKKALYGAVISKVILSLIGVVLCLLLHQYIYILFFAIFAYTMHAMDTLHSQSIHGDLIKLKNVKKGLGFFYFVEKAILYPKSFYLYEEFQKQLPSLYLEHPELHYKITKVIQYIYLINTVNNSIPVSRDTIELISREVLDDGSIYLTSKLGQEQLDLLKAMLCYSLMHDDELLGKVNHKMMQLSTESHGIIRNRISWYVEIGRHKTISKQTNLTKNTLIRHSQRLSNFTNYQKIVGKIENKMHEICKIEQ